MDFASSLATDAVFFNSGQVCVAGTRTFVHEDIYDELLNKCVEKAKARTIGNPMDNANQSGPQVRAVLIIIQAVTQTLQFQTENRDFVKFLQNS